MRRGHRLVACALTLLFATSGATADPAPVDGMLFPIDTVVATGVSPNAFVVSWRDLSVYSTGFQIQYSYDANAEDEDWNDAAPIQPPRRVGTGAGGYRSIVVTITGLPQASPQIVYFRVRATIAHGTPGDPVADVVNGPWSPVDGALLGPLAPSDVVVQISNSLPLLTWNNHAFNDDLWAGTYIYRSEDNAPLKVYATLPTDGPTASSFFDAAIKPNKKYTYAVLAFRQTSVLAHVEQSTSNGTPATVSIVTPSTPPPNVPAAPSALGAVAVSSTRADLTWTDNATTEDGFAIERSVDNGVTFSIRATINTANLQAWSDTSLYPGGTYTYRVRAYNAGGQSDPSNTATVTAPSLPPPVWVSPDASKQNQVQAYQCAIWGTANYSAGVRNVYVLVVNNADGATTMLPLAPVSPTTNEWRIDWHTYEFAPGRYHLKAYSHAKVNGLDLYSTPSNVIGWTVAADSLPCRITNP